MALIGHGCADRGERIATDTVDLLTWGADEVGHRLIGGVNPSWWASGDAVRLRRRSR